MAVLSLGAFGIGGYTAGLLGSLAGPPVSELSVFQVTAGVPAASDKVATTEAIAKALRARIAVEYVSDAAAQPAQSKAGSARAVSGDRTLAKLEAADETVVREEASAQVALAVATEEAGAAQAQQLSWHHWKEVLIRVIVTVACFLGLIIIAWAITTWASIPVTLPPVLCCAAILLIAFMVTDLTTWVAGLVLVLLLVTFLIRDRGRQTVHA